MQRARRAVALALVTVVVLVAGAVAAEGERWEYAAGARLDGDDRVEVELWRRPAAVVLRESSRGRLVFERRCEDGTYESFDIELRHRVVRTGLSRHECTTWALGPDPAGRPRRVPATDGPAAALWRPVTGRRTAAPQRLDTTAWTVEAYHRLTALEAAHRLGLEALPLQIGGLRFETAFDFISIRGTRSTYVIWSGEPGRDLQAIAGGSRVSIAAPDPATMAAARAALRR